MDDVTIYTFHTISQALKFEKILKKNKIEVKLRPVPRKLSSSCGNCAYVNTKDVDKIEELCEENKIEYDERHKEKDL